MGTRGKASKAELAIVTRDDARRLRPSADLGEPIAEIFREIVATMPSDHFKPCDRTLLEVYAHSVWTAREAHKFLSTEGQVVGGRISPWVTILEKASKSVAMLSMKLRIAPQARTRPETLSRRLKREAPSGYDALDLD